jgi:choline dehydrogenase-like flavoprotein
MSDTFDYIIIGAGPAGCVMANRLSADPSVSVALLEAGLENRSYLIDMPKGYGKLLFGSRFVSFYPLEPDQSGQRQFWVRGKTLGGSTSVNGMAYSRGQPEDYDHWEAMGATGWGWRTMREAFRAIEDHELGAGESRGAGGAMHVIVNRYRYAPNEAALEAANAIGLPVKEDVNADDQTGIGRQTAMIRDGRRMSAADAYLKPVRHRRNLTVLTETSATKILFEGKTARGVACVSRGAPRTLRAKREVLCCAGALETPKLLMLSGIGPADELRSHGIPVLVDRPTVGANMADHRGIAVQWRLKKGRSNNREFSGPRLWWNAIKYFLSRRGIMSYGSHEIMGFAQTLPQSKTADTQMFISPFSRVPGATKPQFEAHPGMQCLIYPSRPTSRGQVRLASADPLDFPRITPNQLTTDYDRAITVAMVRYVRRLFEAEPLKPFIDAETFPGPAVQSDEEILELVRTKGTWGNHTCGTARMGSDSEAVVDTECRVRGVDGLRVVDASIFPSMVSANTTAPVLATAWRAADLMLGKP